MYEIATTARRVFSLLVLSTVVSCSGGGGGGDGGGGNSGPGFSVSPSSLSFSASSTSSPTPNSQSITVTVTSGTVYLGAYYSGAAISSATFAITGPTTGTITVYPTSPSSLGAGTYTGTIRVVGCNDANCNSQVSGSPKDIGVTYVVGNGVAASPSSLTFTGAAGGPAPSAQNISVTAAGSTSWTATSNRSWLTVGTTSGSGSGTVSASVDPSGLAVGIHTGSITFSPTSNGDTSTVNVTLTVSAPALQASPSNLSFNGVAGGSFSARTISVSMNNGTAVNWNATASANWLVLSKTNGTTSDSLTVNVNTSGLSAGTHTASISFAGTGVANTPTVNVTLVLTQPQIVLNQSALTFSGVNGAPFSAQTINVSVSNGDTVAWTANPGASWLSLSKTTGTTPDLFTVNVNPANGPMASGTYTSTITLTGTSSGFSLTSTINVTLTLTQATLSASPTNITLGGSTGRDFSSQTLQLSLNTGVNSHAWTASTANSWLDMSTSSGTASSTPTSITLTPDLSGISGGTYNGSITFTAQVNGDTMTRSVPVTLNIDTHKILVDSDGVALTSTPSLSRLTRTLQVRDNLGLTTNWSASSSQSWLTVTSSGTTTDNLVLTANPTGLTTDTIHYATVTISSSDASVANTETVRVGLWVGSTTPSTTTEMGVSRGAAIADPVRPYVYTHSGGSSVTVHNVYNGVLVTTISGFAATSAGTMAISSDGSTLFIGDWYNYTITPVNLDTFTAASPWSLTNPASSVLRYARTNGNGIVIVGDGRIYDAATGSRYSATYTVPFGTGVALAANRQGTRFCAVSTGISTYTINCYPLDFTSLNGDRVLLGTLKWASQNAYARDAALNADGSLVYVAANNLGFTEYDATVDGSTMSNLRSFPGVFAAAANVGTDDRLYFGASVIYGSVDTWIYNNAGTLQSSYYVSGYGNSLVDRGLVVTGDALRMVTLTPALKFTTVGQ
jgi:hypothetical protein